MEGQLSSTPSISQSYSFIATDEAESIVAAVEAAENNSDNPPGLGSGAASAPEVNFQEGYAKGNPPVAGDLPAKNVSQLGHELLTPLHDPRNKVPCPVREKVMDTYFKLQQIMFLSAGRAMAEGQVMELRRELDGMHSRHSWALDKVIDVRPTLFTDVVGGRPPIPAADEPRRSPPLRPASTGSSNRPKHALHIKLKAPSASPARDIATLIKSTSNPKDIGVGPITFRPRNGLTVTSQVRQYNYNLEQAIATTPVTRSTLDTQKPLRRQPQLNICGVDPAIVEAMLLNQTNAQNGLNISPEDFCHRTVYTEHFGTKVHAVEVSPVVFAVLREKRKLHIGWTSCENEPRICM